MKKLLLSAFLGAALTATAATPEIITETPEGTLYTNVYTYNKYTSLISNGQVGATSTDGRRTDLVVNEAEKTIYIHNPVSEYTQADAWIKGTFDEEGNVEFVLPQPVYYRPATETVSELTVYATMVIPNKETGTTVFEPNTANPNLKMKWDGTTLVQVLPDDVSEADARFNGYMALLNNGEGFSGFGEADMSYTIFDAPITLPEDVELVEEAFTNKYTTEWNDPMTQRVTIYREKEGSRIWIAGLNYLQPEQLVTATEDAATGNLTIVSGQFMGYTEDFFTFFYGGTVNSKYKAEWADETVLEASADAYKANNDMIINIGNHKPTVGLGLKGAELSSIDALILTPVDPYFDMEMTEVIEDEGMYLAVPCFTIEAISTDGNALDTKKLYYTLFVNGEPFTFDPDMALGELPEAMTEVPWSFDNGDDIGAMEDGYHVVLAILFEEVNTMGVQAIYKNRDGETRSALISWPENSGLEETVAKPAVVKTEYFDLSGRTLSRPEGLCIIRTTRADGSISSRKAIVIR